MKILLIFPPSTIYGEDPTMPAIVPPLGLAYIAGYLEKHGYLVTILDARSASKDRIIRNNGSALYGLTDEEIQKEVKGIAPDIVGITCMYTAYSGDVHRVARVVKKIDINIPVIVGGAHASTFPALMLKDTNIDVVVHAEGEETFLDLVRHTEVNRKFDTIQGISCRVDGKIIATPQRPFIEDLDKISFPARHLLDMKLYIESSNSPYNMRVPGTTMITSRGCPMACIYCTIQSVWGESTWRGRSPKNIVDEMEMLYRDYGINEFHLLDDSAGTSKKRLGEICDEIINRGLDIKWTTPNGIAHWNLDEEILDKMKAAGCYRVTFGIESGNIEVRKFIGKPFKLEQAEKIIRHANKIGMWTICTFILGFPYETEEAIRDTINFACRSNTDMAVFYLLCPHPGTKVYDIFKKEGLLNMDHILDPHEKITSKDFEEIGLKLAGKGANTKYHTPADLHRYLALAYKTFFKARLKRGLNPVSTLQKIKNKEDFIYICRIGKIGLKSAFDSIMGNAFRSQSMWKHRKDKPKAAGEYAD